MKTTHLFASAAIALLSVAGVPAQAQLDRLTRQRGMPEDQARERMEAQGLQLRDGAKRYR